MTIPFSYWDRPLVVNIIIPRNLEIIIHCLYPFSQVSCYGCQNCYLIKFIRYLFVYLQYLGFGLEKFSEVDCYCLCNWIVVNNYWYIV